MKVDDMPSRLRSINEAQHRISGHVLKLLAGDRSRYPDEVLVSVILEQDDPVLRGQVAAAFARSLAPCAVA